jgi:hypothetical protein
MEESIVRQVVKDAVHETLTGLGFTPCDPQQTQQDMIYLRKLRRGSEEMGAKIRTASITTLVAGMLYALFEGIRGSLRM